MRLLESAIGHSPEDRGWLAAARASSSDVIARGERSAMARGAGRSARSARRASSSVVIGERAGAAAVTAYEIEVCARPAAARASSVLEGTRSPAMAVLASVALSMAARIAVVFIFIVMAGSCS
jgi:hypothetical protein